MLLDRWTRKHFDGQNAASRSCGHWIEGLYPAPEGAIYHTWRGRPHTRHDNSHIYGYLPDGHAVIQHYQDVHLVSVKTAESIKDKESEIKRLQDEIVILIANDPEPPGPQKHASTNIAIHVSFSP